MTATTATPGGNFQASTIALGVVFATLTTTSMLGNSLVCLAIYGNKRLRKLENSYFFSLAIADLMLSVLVMTFAAGNDLAGHWPFGRSYCKVWMSLDITCCTASILNLCAISFDRYVHVHKPMKYTDMMTPLRVFSAIVCVWTCSVIVGFVPWFFEYNNEHHATSTADNGSIASIVYDNISSTNARLVQEDITTDVICKFELAPFYAVLSSTVSFFVPCIVMIMAYGKLYHYARRHVKIINSQYSAYKITVTVLPNVDAVTIHRLDDNHMTPPICRPVQRKKEVSDQKARLTLGIIMGAFLICWLPFFVANIIRSIWNDERVVPDWLFTLLTWLGYTNSTLNPIIYSILNRDFRFAFKRILFCRKQNVNNSKTSLITDNGSETNK